MASDHMPILTRLPPRSIVVRTPSWLSTPFIALQQLPNHDEENNDNTNSCTTDISS